VFHTVFSCLDPLMKHSNSLFTYNAKHTYIKHYTLIFFYLEVATSPVLGSSVGNSGPDSAQHGGLKRVVSHAPFTSPQSNVYSAVWRVGYLRSSLLFIIIIMV
jgi:hypothetical protein